MKLTNPAFVWVGSTRSQQSCSRDTELVVSGGRDSVVLIWYCSTLDQLYVRKNEVREAVY